MSKTTSIMIALLGCSLYLMAQSADSTLLRPSFGVDYTGEMQITDNTHTIHHYMASWVKKQNHLQGLINRVKYFCVRILCMFKHYEK